MDNVYKNLIINVDKLPNEILKVVIQKIYKLSHIDYTHLYKEDTGNVAYLRVGEHGWNDSFNLGEHTYVAHESECITVNEFYAIIAQQESLKEKVTIRMSPEDFENVKGILSTLEIVDNPDE
ncbi:hypothetical protein [Marinicella marina]|uniref:hypothetical protein n=1 Tax=Marinicella marina TaxID=2996016 RepID=UPI0024BCF86F|nr:hypothetical protein [Marinicella marina]MDJ1139655.1 hypothetical protein [Marinicella marina]